MNIRNRMLSASVGLCLTLGMWTVAQVSASAAIILSSPHADFSAAPYTISFGGGAAAYTFTDVDEPSTDPLTVAAVSTGGSALVNAVLGQPIAFQLGTVVGATGYDFAPLPTPAGIPDSIAEDSIGLKFSLPDGIHYGFVTTLGPEVILDGYNTTPGGFITVGVPEPATWVMLIIGFGVFGAVAGVRAVITPRPAQRHVRSAVFCKLSSLCLSVRRFGARYDVA
jgi:PEP-CTERM motif